MFQSLKLLAYKALPETTLDNLGKINIVCGKNSSGKSTLLAAINNPDTRRIGLEVGSQQVDHLVRRSIRATGWNGTGYPALNEIYRDIMVSTIETKGVWYSGEEVTFIGQFVQAFQANPGLREWAFSEGDLLDAYKEVFRDNTASVLIAPKRFVELN